MRYLFGDRFNRKSRESLDNCLDFGAFIQCTFLTSDLSVRCILFLYTTEVFEWISAVESSAREPLFRLCKWASSVDTRECCSSGDEIGKEKMQEKSDGTQIRRRGTAASSGIVMFFVYEYVERSNQNVSA